MTDKCDSLHDLLIVDVHVKTSLSIPRIYVRNDLSVKYTLNPGSNVQIWLSKFLCSNSAAHMWFWMLLVGDARML